MLERKVFQKAMEKDVEMERLRRELEQLRAQLLANQAGSAAESIEGLNVLALRVDADGRVSYVNTELTRYAQAEKSDLLGRPLEDVAKLFGGDVTKLLKEPDRRGESAPRTARDAHERVFEVRVHHRGQAGLVRDIVLHDVTDQQRMRAYARKYFPADLDKLSDQDLRSFKFPERRYMSVSFTDLRGFTALSEELSPEEVRAVVNAYMEEVAQAISAAGGTVDKFVGDEVMALFGAPLFFPDHAFRAVACACDQVERVERLREQFQKAGKTLPPCGVGLNAGDMVLGNMGSATRQNYTVLGPAVNLASRLCGAASGGEVLLSESFYQQVVRQMPKGWVSTTWTETDHHYDRAGSSTEGGKVERVLPLPEGQAGRVIGWGPEGEKPVYEFHYRYQLEVKGIGAPVLTLAVKKVTEAKPMILETAATEPERSERLLGRYRLDRPIGRGGMGEVWRARDQFGNRVAVKTLLSGEAATEAQIKRFKREAEIMSRLQHRNLCRVFEVGEWERQHYIAMELVDGVSLRDLMRRPGTTSSASSMAEVIKETKASQSSSGSEGSESTAELSELIREVKSSITRASQEAEIASGLIPVSSSGPVQDEPGEETYGRIFPKQQALSLVHQIGQGVQAAHEAGVLHRDLKPANILLRENGEPVVMDFGLAKLHREDGGELSMSGQVLGTIEYMAPEQARAAKEIDEAADVFSLGAILFEMVTGRKSMRATGNMLADSRRLEAFEPERASKYNRRIDSDLDAILFKALSPTPENRYRSLLAFLSDIEAYQQGRVISAKTPSSFEIIWKLIRRNAAVSTTIAVATALFLIMAGYAFYQITRERDTAALQREAAEARNLLRHEPGQSQRLVQKAVESSLAKLGEVLPSVQFALGDVMVKAPQAWRTYLGEAPVTDLAVLPQELGDLIVVIQNNQLIWLDDKGQRLGEPVTLPEVESNFTLRPWREGDDVVAVWLSVPGGKFWRVDGPGQPPQLLTLDDYPRSIEGDAMDMVTREPMKVSVELIEKLKKRGVNLTLNQAIRQAQKTGGSTLPKTGITSAAISRWEQEAIGYQDGSIVVEGVEQPGQMPSQKTLRGHTDAVTAIAYNAAGDRLASGSKDRTIRITGPMGQYLGDPIRGHEGAILALAWAQDGEVLYSAGADGTVRRWDVRQFQVRRPEPAQFAMSLDPQPKVMSPNGRWEAVSDGSPVVRIYDRRAPKAQPKELYGHWLPVRTLAFSPDSQFLVTGGADNAVMLWNVAGDLVSPPILIHVAPVTRVTFSLDGKTVNTQSEDGTSREISATAEGWLEQLKER